MTLWCMSIAFGALLTAMMVPVVLRLANHTGHIDHPVARASHTQPTATGGGLTMYIVLAIGVAVSCLLTEQLTVWVWVIVPLTCILSLMGWLDDRQSLPALWRFSVQIVCCLTVIYFLLSTGTGDTPRLITPNWAFWLLVPGLLLFFAGTLNVFNFMDGSDGLAAMQGVFIALMMGWLFLDAGSVDLAIPAGLLAGVCLGFLPWNFPKARMFMGDAGSVPLGFALFGLMLTGVMHGFLSLPVGLLLFSVFYIDAGLTLLGRLLRGEEWYTAHKKHLYQRMIQQGASHAQVLIRYQAINWFLVAPVAVLASSYGLFAWPILVVMVLLLSTVWLVIYPRMGGGDKNND